MRRRAPSLEKDRASVVHSILPDQFTLFPKSTGGGETINDDGLSKKAIWSMPKLDPLECVKQSWAIFCFSQFLHFCQIRWNFFPQPNLFIWDFVLNVREDFTISPVLLECIYDLCNKFCAKGTKVLKKNFQIANEFGHKSCTTCCWRVSSTSNWLSRIGQFI